LPFQRRAFDFGQGALTGPLAWQPERHGEADLVFPAALVVIELVGFVGNIQAGRLRQPAVGRLPTCADGIASRPGGTRLRLTCPGGLEGLFESWRRFHSLGRGNQCGKWDGPCQQPEGSTSPKAEHNVHLKPRPDAAAHVEGSRE
jgi:hypothetical protein